MCHLCQMVRTSYGRMSAFVDAAGMQSSIAGEAAKSNILAQIKKEGLQRIPREGSDF